MPESAQPTGDGSRFALSDEHRMLLDIRDTLYDGSWESFARDLEARRKSKPHVFETVADSPEMLATIATHLALIDEMRAWERRSGRILRSGATAEDAEE